MSLFSNSEVLLLGTKISGGHIVAPQVTSAVPANYFQSGAKQNIFVADGGIDIRMGADGYDNDSLLLAEGATVYVSSIEKLGYSYDYAFDVRAGGKITADATYLGAPDIAYSTKLVNVENSDGLVQIGNYAIDKVDINDYAPADYRYKKVITEDLTEFVSDGTEWKEVETGKLLPKHLTGTPVTYIPSDEDFNNVIFLSGSGAHVITLEPIAHEGLKEIHVVLKSGALEIACDNGATINDDVISLTASEPFSAITIMLEDNSDNFVVYGRLD